MRRLIGLGTLLVAVAAAVPAAAIPSAVPIRYTISGSFTGWLGEDSFVDTQLTFTGLGNTGTFFDSGDVTLVPVTLTVTNPLGAGPLSVTTREAFGVNRADGGYVFFEQIDGSGNQLYNFPVVATNATFGSYSGRSFVGATTADYTFSSSTSTTGGVLAPISGTDITFSATAVPEPAVWGLMIAGFGLVGASQRGRRSGVVAA
jgi:hypothetical protein